MPFLRSWWPAEARRAVVREICPVLILVITAALIGARPLLACAEPSLGLTGGLTFAGDQDVLIVDRNGSAQSKDVSAAIGPVAGVTGTFWWSYLGLQLDGLYWKTSAEAARPGSSNKAQVNQDRSAVLISLMGRLSLGKPGGPFAYGGVSGGIAVLGFDPGQTTVGPAVGAVAGVAIPITRQLRVRTEVRYLLTHDVDPKPGRGTATEVSGHRSKNPGRALFGPHFDTQFVPLLVGIDYVF